MPTPDDAGHGLPPPDPSLFLVAPFLRSLSAQVARNAEPTGTTPDSLIDSWDTPIRIQVAEHARRQAVAAQEHITLALSMNLEAQRQGMTAAVQERLRGYFGECQRDDRRPLTWDTASYAVGAMIEYLKEELGEER